MMLGTPLPRSCCFLAVLVAAAGLSAFTFAARPAPAQAVFGKAVPGRPPAGLQRAADKDHGGDAHEDPVLACLPLTVLQRLPGPG